MWQPAGCLRPDRFAAAQQDRFAAAQVAEQRRARRPLLTRTLHLSVRLLAGTARWAEGALPLWLPQLEVGVASVAIPCRTRGHESVMLHQGSDFSLGDVPHQIFWLVRPHAMEARALCLNRVAAQALAALPLQPLSGGGNYNPRGNVTAKLQVASGRADLAMSAGVPPPVALGLRRQCRAHALLGLRRSGCYPSGWCCYSGSTGPRSRAQTGRRCRQCRQW